MNLEQLEAINAVVEKGSFRAAAEHLNRSQPALSATIKNLEEEFDLLIFDRSEYRPKLTEAGAAFLNVAKSTLDAAHYAARVAVELGKQKAETRLHISLDPLISSETVELIAQECARPVLPVNLIMEKSIMKGSYLPLLDGKIDLAFASCPQDETRIEKIMLETVTLVGAISRKLLQEKRKPTEAFLRQNPQIIVYDRAFDEADENQTSNTARPELGHKIFVGDHFSKLRLIEAGIGWGRISKTELEAAEDLIMIDRTMMAPITLELCILRARHRPIGPIARAIWKAFEQKMSRKPKA